MGTESTVSDLPFGSYLDDTFYRPNLPSEVLRTDDFQFTFLGDHVGVSLENSAAIVEKVFS